MTIRETHTPSLRPDADPVRSADYANRLAKATNVKEIRQVHREFVDLRQRRGVVEMRDEWRRLANAKPGTDENRARKTLGTTLLLFGIFGFPFVLAALLLIGWAVWSIVSGIVGLF